MRINETKGQLQVICNACGRSLKVRNGMLLEGCFHGQSDFGYFSNKDTVSQEFDLCEECYDKMVGQFRIPVTDVERTEVM